MLTDRARLERVAALASLSDQLRAGAEHYAAQTRFTLGVPWASIILCEADCMRMLGMHGGDEWRAVGTHGGDAARVEVPTSGRLSPWVVATNQPVLIADVSDEVHRHNLLVDPVRFGAYAGAALVLDRGLALGVLAA